MRRSSTNDRNALAEIRQSYLLRQPLITDQRYKNSKTPSFSIKPDYYDYGGLNYFPTKRTPLPYYVVPVLYVPQKVLSTKDIDQGRAWLRSTHKDIPEDIEYENQDDDLISKVGSYTNSESTAGISTVSSPNEEATESFKTFNCYVNSANNKSFESGSHRSNTDGRYAQNVFGGGETYKFDDGQKEQAKNVFWKYKNPYTIFNKYPLTSSESKNLSCDEGQSGSNCDHFDTKPKQKICVDCLKDKYLKNHECDKPSKNIQTNFDFDCDDSGFFKSSSRESTRNLDSKSTQTISTPRIHSGTQTETQKIGNVQFNKRGLNRKIKGSQIPQRTTNGFKSCTELVKNKNEKSPDSIMKVRRNTGI